MSSQFTQDFFTQRRNYNDGNTRIGESDRIWYDSNTNTMRISNGAPGGNHIDIGGDQGPIRSLLFEQTGPGVTTEPGMITWNQYEDCLDIYQHDGSTLQAGLENYIQVYNNTANTLVNGTVVRFGGVYSDNIFLPEAIPMISDGSDLPLYIIGVMTNDLAPGATGRATLLGKVRDVDTSGNAVGETWSTGDLLYVNPQYPGKLTKVQPTAPNVVISVAAVLSSDETEGVLLVRPTVWPRVSYGEFSDTTNQYANVSLQPYTITHNTTDINNGHHIDPTNTSRIVADRAGLYNYQFSIQLISSSSSAKDFFIWARKNGTDIPNSARRFTVTGNSEYKDVAGNYVVSMTIDDYFEFAWTSSDSTLIISSPPATAFCPAIPSIITTVTQIAL